jgi:hypothetical protein
MRGSNAACASDALDFACAGAHHHVDFGARIDVITKDKEMNPDSRSRSSIALAAAMAA